LDPSSWRTARVGDVVEADDLVIAVCDIAYEGLPADARPRLHWSVADPAAVDTDAAFEAAFTELTGRIDRLAPVLAGVPPRPGRRRRARSGAARRPVPPRGTGR
jgi:hypothetical protein